MPPDLTINHPEDMRWFRRENWEEKGETEVEVQAMSLLCALEDLLKKKNKEALNAIQAFTSGHVDIKSIIPLVGPWSLLD